jgi:hypothetical protein
MWGPVLGSCTHGDEDFFATMGTEFLLLSDGQLFNKMPSPQISNIVPVLTFSYTAVDTCNNSWCCSYNEWTEIKLHADSQRTDFDPVSMLQSIPNQHLKKKA